MIHLSRTPRPCCSPPRSVWSTDSSTTQGCVFHTEIKRSIFFFAKEMEAGSGAARRQTNPGSGIHYMTSRKEKKATSEIEGNETTFLHLAADTKGCLHRWEIIGFPELFWKVQMYARARKAWGDKDVSLGHKPDLKNKRPGEIHLIWKQSRWAGRWSLCARNSVWSRIETEPQLVRRGRWMKCNSEWWRTEGHLL